MTGYWFAVPGNYIKAPFNLMFSRGPWDYMRITESPVAGIFCSSTEQQTEKVARLIRTVTPVFILSLAGHEVVTEVGYGAVESGEDHTAFRRNIWPLSS